jgi:hypothetical protein
LKNLTVSRRRYSARAAQKAPALPRLSCGGNQDADDRDTTLLKVSRPVAA